MKALSALNKYFNDGVLSPKKKIQEFKEEVDELTMAERQELGELACKELGVPFEA